MADYRAVATIGESIIRLLQTSYETDGFGNELDFKVYTADQFKQPMEAGVSLFVYRIFANGTHRIPPGRVGPDGRRRQTQLPLDVHFLLTAWGKSASLQHTIAAWMMRILEDTPILPAGMLNAVREDVFAPEETVEICLAELSTEDLLRIWETLPQSTYRLSVPYLARNVRVESLQTLTEGEPVQERTFDYRRYER